MRIKVKTCDKGNNKRKELRNELVQARDNSRRDAHIVMSNSGIPRRKDGNKLGLRKRQLLYSSELEK